MAAFAVRTCPELYLILEDRWKNAQPPVGPLPSGPEALVKTRLLCMVPPAEFFKSCAGRTRGGGNVAASALLEAGALTLPRSMTGPRHGNASVGSLRQVERRRQGGRTLTTLPYHSRLDLYSEHWNHVYLDTRSRTSKLRRPWPTSLTRQSGATCAWDLPVLVSGLYDES